MTVRKATKAQLLCRNKITKMDTIGLKLPQFISTAFTIYKHNKQTKTNKQTNSIFSGASTWSNIV